MLHNSVETDIFSKKDILILFTQCNSILKMTNIFLQMTTFVLTTSQKLAFNWRESSDSIHIKPWIWQIFSQNDIPIP